jgi:hypothetical protein
VKRYLIILVALAACGDDLQRGLIYTDPAPGGKLRLVRNDHSSGNHLVLDFIVGTDALTGYSTGFDLPVAPKSVVMAGFTPGTVLDPGSAPVAAKAVIPDKGPLANNIVAALSQKATGTGAHADDANLAPNTVLFEIELEQGTAPQSVIVFDGTAADFILPSGGLRSKVGATVVDVPDVKIGKLELKL